MAVLLLLTFVVCIQVGRVNSFATTHRQSTSTFANSLQFRTRIRSSPQEHDKRIDTCDHRNTICHSSSSSSSTSVFPDEGDNNDFEDEDDIESSKYDVNQEISSSSSSKPDVDVEGDVKPTSTSSLPMAAQLQMQKQQKQIDMLMEMVKNQPQMQQQQQPQQQPQQQQSSTPPKSTTSMNSLPRKSQENELLPPPLPGMFNDEGEEELSDTFSESDADVPSVATSSPVMYTQGSVAPVVPLKAMMFIDGTWLYYSLYRRKEEFDPIVKKFGKGWQYRYRIDWNALPRIVCEHIVGQQINLGWSSSTGIPTDSDSKANFQRPVEIVRASVFTSYKKTTDPKSFRVKMYNDMADANYDIHMLESTSNGPEKCVDISLAVEMLHYATVPNAYDVAILLSGDKDFIPAMVRTRQKGRKVGVVSMRTGCNRALYESPHIKDFDVVWIDDFLDRLLVPLPPDQIGRTVQKVHDRGLLSAFTITKVILDFVSQSPYGKVSSRDIGRYLKNIELPGGTSLLDDVKLGQGGLRRFLQDRMPMVFECIDRPQYLVRDPNDRSYFIAKKDGAVDFLIDEAKKTKFTPEESQFLRTYQSGVVEKGIEEDVYYYTTEALEASQGGTVETLNNMSFLSASSYDGQQEEGLKTDYSEYTVAMLKDVCKDMRLPVSGRKQELIERITVVEGENTNTRSTRQPERANYSTTTSGNDKLEKYLVDIVKYYIVESRGYASSRDLGRFLATNSPSSANANSALSELKENFGGVAAFLNQRSHIFTTVREPSDGDSMNYSFGIKLKDPNDTPRPINTSTNVQAQVPAVLSSRTQPALNVDPNIEAHIERLLREYLRASGGEASSRNIGRYLAANAALDSDSSSNGGRENAKRNTALKQLKEHYGNLAAFLNCKEDAFELVSGGFQSGKGEDDAPSNHSFGVRVR